MPTAEVGVRGRTRGLLIQALYQWQLTGHSVAELENQFRERAEFARIDREFFEELLRDVFKQRDELDAIVARLADRPREQLDPVELAVIYLGLVELSRHLETPYRVVLNEAVRLARSFGAEDGHKYVNALLDRAAAELRAAEYRAGRQH
ncbi:MAG: transcription antitermination factor NusB [Pseudomonadota bacterium]